MTSAELLAQAAIGEGKFAQAFPSFGPERRGAPVLAFNRVSQTKPIRNRAGITEPDVVIVLDSSLLHIVKVTAGLKKDGLLVVNTKRPTKELKSELGNGWQVASIDALAVAREVLGVPIVNTTMIGALIKAADMIQLESFIEPIRNRFGRLGDRNIEAMKRAYQETTVVKD